MTKIKKVKETITQIAEKIKNTYQPEKIILYGSFSYGKPREDSDIDLLIIKDTTSSPIDRQREVRKIVSDPKRLIPFQPIVVTPQELNQRLNIGDQFFHEIISRGEVLYAK